MTTRYPTGAVAPLAAALLLTGCALLGGGKPVQLYRFGAPPTASPATGGVVPTPRYTVLLMPVRFAAGIDGDRVLASRGSETLYIKGLRWVAPAPVLFGEEAQASFRARAPWIALTDRRGGAPADHILQIRIDRFEARYDAGAKAPPTIHVEGEAMLGDVRTPGVSSRYRLVAEQQATAGDAAAIVAAFDQASESGIASTVDWAAGAIVLR